MDIFHFIFLGVSKLTYFIYFFPILYSFVVMVKKTIHFYIAAKT